MYKYRIILKNGRILYSEFNKPMDKKIGEIIQWGIKQNASADFYDRTFVTSCEDEGDFGVRFDDISSYECMKEPFDLEKYMDRILRIINEAINRTPTGTLRNRLTDINMSLMIEKDVIESLIEAEKKNQMIDLKKITKEIQEKEGFHTVGIFAITGDEMQILSGFSTDDYDKRNEFLIEIDLEYWSFLEELENEG